MNQTQTLPQDAPRSLPADSTSAVLEADPRVLQGNAAVSRRVLVVEDHPLLRFALIDALIGQGYDCVGAEHGRAALALLESTCVDLVVTDLSMPQMGGLELIARMASSPVLRSIPIIVVTGSLPEETRLRVLNAGGKAALVRSPRHDDMFEAIRTVLRAPHPGS